MQSYLSSLVHSNCQADDHEEVWNQEKAFSPGKALLLAVGVVALGALALGIASFVDSGASDLLDHSVTYVGIALGAGFVVAVGAGSYLHVNRSRDPLDAIQSREELVTLALEILPGKIDDALSNKKMAGKRWFFDQQNYLYDILYYTEHFKSWLADAFNAGEVQNAKSRETLATQIANRFPMQINSGNSNLRTPPARENYRNDMRFCVKKLLLNETGKFLDRYLSLSQ